MNSIVYDYYAPFPYANYPFGIAPGIISIKRYDNDSLNLTITSFTPYSYIADPDDRWKVGENFANSYLIKNAGDVYRFVGTVGFLSDCSPWYVERTMTKNFSYTRIDHDDWYRHSLMIALKHFSDSRHNYLADIILLV